MEQFELDNLLLDPTKLVSKIQSLAPVLPDDVINFLPENHKVVKDMQYRPKREVEVKTDSVDQYDKPIYRTEFREVHRIPSATQKMIVEWSVRMALSAGIEIDCTPREGVASDEVMLAMIKKTWEDNKLDYICQEIERIKQTYLFCLVVWYSVPAEEGFWEGIASDRSKFKMRCVHFSPEDGSTIVPLRDQYRDMIGAARLYTVNIEDKDIDKMDLMLSDRNITYKKSAIGWEIEKITPLTYGKANFVLHEQPGKRPEWADVLPKLDRVEEVDSDTADENQSSAFPILVASGDILDSKGGTAKNTRKTFQVENGGKLEYVETQGGQEAASNERKNLREDIFTETSTPNISLNTIAFSGNTPGVSIELGFLPVTNKAKAKQDGTIGMEWQRHMNFLKPAMAVINIDVKPSVSLPMKPKFKVELPRNKTEDYANIVSLVAAGLMSKETAIKALNFTEDPEAEYQKIKEEAALAQSEALKLAQATKPIQVPAA